MRRILIIASCVALVMGGCVWSKERAAQRAARRLRGAVTDADRLRVRSGCVCCRDEATEETLCTLGGNRKVSDFAKRLNFFKLEEECACCGDITFEFYRGSKLLAMTDFHHSTHLRCPKLWKGDAYLTDTSLDWLVDWLAHRGIAWPKKQVQSMREEKRIGKLARAELKKVVPPGFMEGIEKARARFRRSTRDSSVEVDRFIRSFFGSDKERFSTLFRILGALPMSWTVRYWAQFNVHHYVVRAPAAELDRAFKLAAESKDPMIRSGAARLIFSEPVMERYGKTEDEIRKWMMLMAAEGYASPFAMNRRVVIRRLGQKKDKDAVELLIRATTDPDPLVRREAIVALGGYDDERVRVALEDIAQGKVTPRPERKEKPLDFARGEGTIYAIPHVFLGKTVESDRELAERLLKEMEKPGTNDAPDSSDQEKENNAPREDERERKK